MPRPKIWAHRGASAYAPENTMPAFELASQMGADGIEIDIQLTKDGVPVVCHDEVLERVSDGAGKVRDYTLADLKTRNFNQKIPDLGKMSIVTLEQCYRFAKQAGLFVNTEIKYYDNHRWEELNNKSLEIASKTNMEDSVLYSSFHHQRLYALKQKSPGIRIGLLYDRYIESPWVMAKELDADALHPHYLRLWEQKLPEQCRQAGILLHPWTVNQNQAIEEVLAWNVDAIISDKPDVVRRILLKMERK